MITPPPEVSVDDVVTAEQWENLVRFIHEALWCRPSTYCINCCSTSTSRSFTSVSAGDTFTQPYLDAQAAVSWIALATGRPSMSGTSYTSGVYNYGLCYTYSGARRDAPRVAVTEPLPKPTASGTNSAVVARAPAISTVFLGRPD